MWWENNRGFESRTPIRRVRCPVCKTGLGPVTSGKASFHCDDCRATYTFTSVGAKPTAQLDSTRPKACHCASCLYRDGIVEDEKPKTIGGSCQDCDEQ